MQKAKSLMMNDDTGPHCELDSHADSACVGKNCFILAQSGRTVDVSVFVGDMGIKTEVPIVTAAVAYIDTNGDTWVLVIHEALYFENLERDLLNPNQIRLQGNEVNESPKSMKRNPTPRDHTIYLHEADLVIDQDLYGVVSYFPTRRPTLFEIESYDRVDLTSPSQWNPHDTRYQEDELNTRSIAISGTEHNNIRKNDSTTILPSVSYVSTATTSNRRSVIRAEDLAHN